MFSSRLRKKKWRRDQIQKRLKTKKNGKISSSSSQTLHNFYLLKLFCLKPPSISSILPSNLHHLIAITIQQYPCSHPPANNTNLTSATPNQNTTFFRYISFRLPLFAQPNEFITNNQSISTNLLPLVQHPQHHYSTVSAQQIIAESLPSFSVKLSTTALKTTTTRLHSFSPNFKIFRYDLHYEFHQGVAGHDLECCYALKARVK
ncbi:unnamed protein product [Vicia faba]|uniref:Uncharacterized protein n=1 Tax=Vicia faba TaxID=3906 RepID=A0AAV0YEZ2_VICFA|nr:unnamed protein product [Vicia faba]